MDKKREGLLRKPSKIAKKEPATAAVGERLLGDIRQLIESTRGRIAIYANAEIVVLYWHIGGRILKEILAHKRAGYGKRVISTLSERLVSEYGKGFTRANLFNMVRFAEVFPDVQIVHALSGQLSWTHFREIIYIDDPLKRDFYAEMSRVERWSTRTLHNKIHGMLYERTAVSRKPAKLAKQELESLRNEDRMTPDLVFRDPYILDFLGIADTYSERDLEATILRELERFLLELGSDFTFIARQKRITIDHDDYYLDLLFYHRGMCRLVAIELKLGKFKAADKGQMELYLRWLDRYERREGEDTPLGLILCGEKTTEHVELLQLEKSGIRVSEYLTALPPRKILEARLHDAIRIAREQLAVHKITNEGGKA